MPVLVSKVLIQAPIERCFDITRSIDVHEATSTLIHGKAVGGKTSGLSETGDETTWSARFFCCRFRVRTRIKELVPPTQIHEVRVKGIARPFDHTYTLLATEQGTLLVDEFEVGLPLGRVGDFIFRVFLKGHMERVQEHRLSGLKEICEGDS